MAGTVITQSICNSGLIAPPRELVTFFLRWDRVCAITSRRKNSVSLSATTLVLRSTFYRTIRFMFKYHLQHKWQLCTIDISMLWSLLVLILICLLMTMHSPVQNINIKSSFHNTAHHPLPLISNSPWQCQRAGQQLYQHTLSKRRP